MKTAAIALDAYKLPIFKKHLDAAAYKYTEHPISTSGMVILKVSCEWISDLQPVVEAANSEAIALGGAK